MTYVTSLTTNRNYINKLFCSFCAPTLTVDVLRMSQNYSSNDVLDIDVYLYHELSLFYLMCLFKRMIDEMP